MKILGSKVDCFSDKQGLLDVVENLVVQKHYGYVCFANVHMLVEAYEKPSFCDVLTAAEIVCPDGRPLSVMQKMAGNEAVQVRGEDAMLAICAMSAKKAYRVGLLGSTEKVLGNLTSKLLRMFPNLEIVYVESPPFRELSQCEVNIMAGKINEANVDYLFVGLGCPKQELLMYRIYRDLHCVLFGVGAAFDFISGEKATAPAILSNMGLEWVFRLICEPRRLFRRYFVTNIKFMFILLKTRFKSVQL